jgi:hypothetical protein
MLLRINVANKVATYQKRCGRIVCGNSDYKIKFTFDGEWSSISSKTARFIWGGHYVDVEIKGDTCDVPRITNTDRVEVGVYAGNLKTTAGATIECVRSILCVGATDRTEAPDPTTGSGSKNVMRSVLTAAEMDTILANAKSSDVGTCYIYLDTSTANYTKGSIYKIVER